MSAGSRAFVESLGQFGQSIQNLGDTIYKVDADNTFKNKSLEYMQKLKEFDSSLLQDPDHGTPGQMDGYMLKWDTFKNKIMEDANNVKNPLARKNLLQYVEQVSSEQYEKVSAYQFQNWSKSMVAAAQQRIDIMLKDSNYSTKDKFAILADEISSLRANNIISPIEEQNIVQQYGQQIIVDDAKLKAIAALNTGGYGAGTKALLGLVGQTYDVNGMKFTFGTEELNKVVPYVNVYEKIEEDANEKWLNVELGKAIKGDKSDFTIDKILAHPTSRQTYYLEKWQELNPARADEYTTFIKIKDAIRTGSLYEGKSVDFDLLSSLKFKNTNYSYTLYNDWAAKQPDNNLKKLSQAADVLLSTLVFGKKIDPNEKILTLTMIDEMKVDDAIKAKYREMYWSAQKQLQDKAQTDNNAKLIAKIFNGTATEAEVLASDPEHLGQNYSFYLSTQDRNKANAQDNASMEIMGLIFVATKEYEDGNDIGEKLKAIGAKLKEKKGVITNPSVFTALNNEYLKLYQASVSKGSAEYLTKTLIPEIKKNPSKYTMETIFSDSKLTFEDKIKAVSLLDSSKMQATERDGILLAMNLSNLANGLPLEIPNKNLPVNFGPEKYDGMIERGNLDLNHRPVVKMEDGSIATVRSITIEEDGHYILIPTISKDGRLLSNKQAIEEYYNTGEHLGVFGSKEAADKYANELHENQAKLYDGATNDNILTEDWLNEHKGQLSDQTYSTLLNALKTVKANAYITTTEDTINNSIRNYKNNAYTKGAGDATEKKTIIDIIDNARMLTPEKRAALKESLDTIDYNAERIAKQREDEAFQAESWQHTREDWELVAKQRKEQETRKNNASAKLAAFTQNLDKSDTKTAQSKYDQYVKDIWVIYSDDPNTANTWIHAADVKLATKLNADYAKIDKRLSEAFDEYIKEQTIPGYKGTGVAFTEELVKDLFPNATETDNKMRDYWLNKKFTFDNSKEALDAQSAPAKIEFSDKMRNMWNGLLGLPGYDPNNILSDDWFQTENAKKLDPTTYHQYSDELSSFNAAAAAKKTQLDKANSAVQEALPESEKRKANTYLGVLEWIANIWSMQGSTYGAGTTPAKLTIEIDGKPMTISADKATFDAIVKNNAKLFVEAGLLDKVGVLTAKMMDLKDNKNYTEIDNYIESKFGKKEKYPANYLKPEVRDILGWLDIVKTNNPTPTQEDIAKIKKVIDEKKLNMELPQTFQLQQGVYDISEKYIEGTQKHAFDIFMTYRDGVAVPSFKGFEPIFNAWKAASLKYINQALPNNVKLVEKVNAKAETFSDGSVDFVVNDRKVLDELGVSKDITGVRFYMGLYGKDAVPIREFHQYDAKTKATTISVYAYVPWFNGTVKWVPVVGTKDNGITRYMPKDPSMFNTVSQPTSKSTSYSIFDSTGYP